MMWVLLFAGIAWLTIGSSLVVRGKLLGLQIQTSLLVVALTGPVTASLIVYVAFAGAASSGGPLIGKTRITVTGIGVRLQPGQAPLLIGGDKASDGLIARNAAPGLIRIWAEPDLPRTAAPGRAPCAAPAAIAEPAARTSRSALRLCAAVAGNSPPEASLVEFEDVPYGLVPVPSISVCSKGCGRGGAGPETPQEESLYLAGAVAGARAGIPSYWVDDSGRAFARPARRGGADGGIQLRDGTRIAIRTAAPLEPGELSTRLRLAQAWTVSWRSGMVQLKPARPEILLSEPGPVALVTAADGGRVRADGNIMLLRSVGRDFAGLLARAKLILPSAAVDQTYVKSGATTIQNNDSVALADADRKLTLRVEPLTIAEGLPARARSLAILFLVAGAALTWQVRRENALAAMLLAAAETLLTLRILIAVEGGMVDDTIRALNALPSALVALPLGTMVVALAMAPVKQMLRIVLGFSLLGALALVLVGEIRGGVDASVRNQVLVLLGLAALPLLARLAAMAKSGVWRPGSADSDPESGYAIRGFRIPGGLWPVVVFTLLAAGAIALLRWSVRPLGKEDIYVGDMRLAFSILFVPLTLAAIAPLLSRVARASSVFQLLAGFVAFILFVGLGILLPNAGIAGDSGAALVLTLAVTVAAAVAVLARRSPLPRTAAIWAVAAAALCTFALAGWARGAADWWQYPSLGFLALLLLGFLAFRGAPARTAEAVAVALWLGPVTLIGAILIMVAATAGRPIEPRLQPGPIESAGTAYTRLLAVVAPERFAEMMSRDAVRIRSTIVHLRDYSATPDGRGFLNLPPPTELRNQQFTDYAAAIHLISPFGRWGIAGLILMLGGVAILACGATAAAGTARAWTGGLAMITFTATSTYIILGNALAAPFTGRNVYLLAPTSNADLIEGLLLLALGGGMLQRSRGT